jgi:hypothetical protein
MSLARARKDLSRFGMRLTPMSKYIKDVVGGADKVAVEKAWPRVCGCRAKTMNLLKSDAFTLEIHRELHT